MENLTACTSVICIVFHKDIYNSCEKNVSYVMISVKWAGQPVDQLIECLVVSKTFIWRFSQRLHVVNIELYQFITCQ